MVLYEVPIYRILVAASFWLFSAAYLRIDAASLNNRKEKSGCDISLTRRHIPQELNNRNYSFFLIFVCECVPTYSCVWPDICTQRRHTTLHCLQEQDVFSKKKICNNNKDAGYIAQNKFNHVLSATAVERRKTRRGRLMLWNVIIDTKVMAVQFMVLHLYFLGEMRKISDRTAGLSTKVQNSYLPNVSDRDSNKVSPKYKLIQVLKQLPSKHKVRC
jgi:hypothetical protein